MIEAKPENLIGDQAYDSDKLDDELLEDGIEMIAPHRGNLVKPKRQDGRSLRRYERRWLVELFFAWVQWQRRFLCPYSLSLGRLRREFSWFRAMGNDQNPTQAISRMI